MSINIYSGARIVGISNRDAILAEVTERLERLALEDTITDLAHTAVSIVDSRIRSELSPVAEAAKDDAPKVFVRIWYADDELTDTVAVYTSGPGAAFTEALTVDGITEYGYWDSTDHPDEVTDEQWSERLAYWDRVTPTGMLKETMTDIVVNSPEPDINDPAIVGLILERIQSPQKRARNVAANLTYTGQIETLWKVLNPPRDYAGLPELIDTIESLLADITAELLTTAALTTSITLERHPDLGPLVETVKTSLAGDSW